MTTNPTRRCHHRLYAVRAYSRLAYCLFCAERIGTSTPGACAGLAWPALAVRFNPTVKA